MNELIGHQLSVKLTMCSKTRQLMVVQAEQPDSSACPDCQMCWAASCQLTAVYTPLQCIAGEYRQLSAGMPSIPGSQGKQMCPAVLPVQSSAGVSLSTL